MKHPTVSNVFYEVLGTDFKESKAMLAACKALCRDATVHFAKCYGQHGQTCPFAPPGEFSINNVKSMGP